jgi:ATP-dependent DNA helicase RecG
VLYGRLEPGARAQMIHPEMEAVEDDDSSHHMGRIVPIYPLTTGVSQRWVRRLIATILEESVEELEETLPEPLRLARGWPGVAAAVRELHFPSSWTTLESAKQRLAFDELLLLQLALAQRRAQTMATVKPHRYMLDGPLTQGLRQRLPFQLTASQERVFVELLEDLRQPYPMYRLLQGDGGCGKTILLILLMAAAAQSGCQAVLMAPTELLADQHARVASAYLEPLGVRVSLISQGVSAAERTKAVKAIASGAIAIVIGTHALLQRHITFQRLSLVIIDEQHKFGVAQRARLAKKAQRPDVLVLTATPIPRTLALSLYGDLAASTITPGRTAPVVSVTSPAIALWADADIGRRITPIVANSSPCLNVLETARLITRPPSMRPAFNMKSVWGARCGEA